MLRGERRDDTGDTGTELVLRGEYLSRRGLHDGDVVRVLPGTAHWAQPGDLVAAASPETGIVVGVHTPHPERSGGARLCSDWDGEPVWLCRCARAIVLGLARPVRVVAAGNAHKRRAQGRSSTAPTLRRLRVPLPYRREASEPVRPAHVGEASGGSRVRWTGGLAATALILAEALGHLA